MKKWIFFLLFAFVNLAQAGSDECLKKKFYLLTINYPKVWEIGDSHIFGEVCVPGGKIKNDQILPEGKGHYGEQFSYYVKPGDTILLTQRNCTTINCTLTTKYSKPMPTENRAISCGGLGFETYCHKCSFGSIC